MDVTLSTWIWVAGLGGAGGVASAWLTRQRGALLIRIGHLAVAAAIAAGDAEPGATSIDNDYYLVNDDETPIDLPVIPDSQVWVLVEGSPETVPAGIEDAVAQPGIYRIEVVVVRGVSLITGVEGVFVP